MRWSLVTLLSVVLIAGLQAQSFEVASIRPSHESPGCFSMLPPGGTHYALTCVQLRQMIALAWKVNSDDVVGGDAKTLDTPYDLSAVSPNGQPWTTDAIPAMLKRLLIERFHLLTRSGTKQVSGYRLVLGKNGLKLEASKVHASQLGQQAGQPSQNSILPGYIRVRGMDMNGIASILSTQAGGPVVDGTGVSGSFDFDLHFSTGDAESNLPSYLVAIEEQLGLKLQPQKVAVNTVVIDHLDREPSPN